MHSRQDKISDLFIICIQPNKSKFKLFSLEFLFKYTVA